MQPNPPASPASRVIALQLIPRLQGAYPQPADPACEMALADAIDAAADRLVRWQDLLAGFHPAPASCAQASPPPGDHQSMHAAVRAGTMPGNPASLQLTAGSLHAVAEAIRELMDAAAMDPSALEAGAQLAGGLDDLAQALSTHADRMRDLSRRLARTDESPGGQERRAQILARLSKAERALARLALATLPS